jgi:pyruvate kinase
MASSDKEDKKHVKFVESGSVDAGSAEEQQQEKLIPYWERDDGGEFYHNAISAYHLSSGRENIRAIVAIEGTGELVRKLAEYKPACPIVAVINDQKLADELNQMNGVMTLMFDGDLFTPDWRMVDDDNKLDDRVAAAANLLKLQGIAVTGDEVVVVTGARPKCVSTTGASITCPVTI